MNKMNNKEAKESGNSVSKDLWLKWSNISTCGVKVSVPSLMNLMWSRWTRPTMTHHDTHVHHCVYGLSVLWGKQGKHALAVDEAAVSAFWLAMSVSLCLCLCVCVHECVCACMCVCVHACVCVCAHACVSTDRMNF